MPAAVPDVCVRQRLSTTASVEMTTERIEINVGATGRERVEFDDVELKLQ